MYSVGMLSYRSYYTGYAAASGEAVPKFEEGFILRRIREVLGVPCLLGIALYLINPDWMHWSQWSDLPKLLRWFGVFLLAGSAALYGWTHCFLGKNFTDTVFIRQQATLIQSGPYHWVRHPMYVSGIMGAVGIFLVTANGLIGVLGITPMLVIMVWRTPIEEKKLLERYGEKYRKYMETTGRYFPKMMPDKD